MPHINDLTFYSLMTNVTAARSAIATKNMVDAWFCLATIYNIAKFASCQAIIQRAVEEALRIETDIMAINAQRPLIRFRSHSADIIKLPINHKKIIPFPQTSNR